MSDLARFGVVEPLGSVADNTRGESAGEVQPASQSHQALVAEIKQHLRMQCERRYYGVIDTLQFSFEPSHTMIRCRSEKDCQVVERLRLMLRTTARLWANCYSIMRDRVVSTSVAPDLYFGYVC